MLCSGPQRTQPTISESEAPPARSDLGTYVSTRQKTLQGSRDQLQMGEVSSIIFKRINLKFAFEIIMSISFEIRYNLLLLWSLEDEFKLLRTLFRISCRNNQQTRPVKSRIYKFGGRLIFQQSRVSSLHRQLLFLFAPVWSLDQYNSREINLHATAQGGNATSWEAAIIQPQTFAQVLTAGNVKQFARHDWSFCTFQSF